MLDIEPCVLPSWCQYSWTSQEDAESLSTLVGLKDYKCACERDFVLQITEVWAGASSRYQLALKQVQHAIRLAEAEMAQQTAVSPSLRSKLRATSWHHPSHEPTQRVIVSTCYHNRLLYLLPRRGWSMRTIWMPQMGFLT